jgi:hypothetical protein
MIERVGGYVLSISILSAVGCTTNEPPAPSAEPPAVDAPAADPGETEAPGPTGLVPGDPIILDPTYSSANPKQYEWLRRDPPDFVKFECDNAIEITKPGTQFCKLRSDFVGLQINEFEFKDDAGTTHKYDDVNHVTLENASYKLEIKRSPINTAVWTISKSNGSGGWNVVCANVEPVTVAESDLKIPKEFCGFVETGLRETAKGEGRRMRLVPDVPQKEDPS